MYRQRQAKGVSSAEIHTSKGEASGNGGSPCLFRIKRKAVSELYREKVDRLQAAEQQLMQQKADAQRAARELTEQARRDGGRRGAAPCR